MGFTPFAPSSGGGYAPANALGFQMWTHDPALAYSSFGVQTGTFDVAMAMCYASATLTKLGCWVSAAGSGGPIGSDVNGLAIYSVNAATGAGTLLGHTVDMSAQFEAVGFQEALLTAPVSVVAGQAYYLAFLSALNTTEPNLMGIITGNGVALPEMNGRYMSAYILAQAAWPASFTQAQLSGDTGTCFQTAR